MRIVVIGAGEVGYHIATRLVEEGHDVVVIERDPDLARRIQNHLDVLVVEGNGASLTCLEKAGVDHADLLLAVTNFDEVNLIACLIAGQFGVRLKVARVSNPDYYDRSGVLEEKRLGADLLINPEREVAREIFKLVHRPAASDVAEFADGRVLLVGLPVTESAPVAGHTLQEIGRNLRDRHFLTVAIDRDGRTIIPDGSTRLLAGDEIYLVAETQYLKDAYRLLGLQRRRVKHVMLLGGGRVGLELSRMLEREGVQLIVIEQSRRRCVALAEQLDHGLVLQGNAIDLELLREEGVAEADAVVCITSADEINLMAALLAKHLGARKVIALLKASQYIPLGSRVGIDAVVSPRLSTANRILQHVRGGRILSIAVMERNRAEAMELEVVAGSRADSRPVRELELPPGAILGALVRDSEVIIPWGDTRIQAGDHVVVFALPEAVGPATAFFA